MAKRKKPAKAPAEVTEPVTHEAPANPDEHKDLLVAKERDRSGDNIFKRFGYWYKTHKKLSIPLTVLLVIAIILVIPFTRYKVLGLFVSKNYSVTVVDATSGKPVSQADVQLASKTAKTDEKGQATITKAPLGNQKLKVTKKYYNDHQETVLVSLTDSKNKKEVKLVATGRQVPVTVTNKITGKPIQGATVTVGESESKTDEKGEAIIVVPPDQPTQKATIKYEGFNHATGEMEVTEQPSDKNKFAITPTGKIYFLSKQSGKIDVVKTNLDGTERQTVLAGTGKEDEGDTTLLATRDWKFLALKARREGDKAKLYLIDTSNDSLTTFDEGDANFNVIGWNDHDFAYKVNRNNKQPWETKQEALKSYNADRKALTVMRETNAQGGPGDYAAEYFVNYYLVDKGLVYTSRWSGCCWYGGANPQMQGKQDNIVQQKLGTTQASVLKTFQSTEIGYPEARPYAPNEIYYSIYAKGKDKPDYYEYEDGQVKPTNIDQATFAKPYPRFILSPSGNANFWADSRDGKNTLFLGDKDGENGQEIGRLSELDPYGWFTEDYLLVSKKDSELFIMGKDKDAPQLKISDYHKPDFYYNGYGGGY